MTAQIEREARRTALILAMGQAILGSCAPIAISIGGLAGFYLLGADKSLATAPVTGFNIGVALGALPAAALMRMVGRRNGFVAGAGVSASGGVIAAAGLFVNEFWLFTLGLLIIGCGGAFTQQFRFAAADNAPEDFKPKAISWVLTGGVFAAVIGPQTVLYTHDLFAPIEFAGAFVGLIGLALIAAVVLSFLRLPKEAPSAQLDDHLPVRPLLQIVRQQRFIVALCCAIGAFALMSFVMTGAPLAMVGCGFTAEQATLGISWHVMAMFAPSFVTGRLIARFGKETIVATGMFLLIGCAIVALSGIALWQFWTALILLGVGWNFGFIGATAMVTETYRAQEKNKVQGLHDFLLFGSVAFASLMSGRTLTLFGWDMINLIVFPVTIFCLALLAWQKLSNGKAG